MPLQIVHVDAFTITPFNGNPAAVCILPEEKPDLWMQCIAAEMSLPATAFVNAQPNSFGLRWFSPAAELVLCGHGTLAAAHVLWEQGIVWAGSEIHFDTKSGRLSATQNGSWIQIDLPAQPSTRLDDSPLALIEAIGSTPRYVGRSRLDYLIELDSEQRVRNLQPDFGLLSQIDARGFIVTSRSIGSDYDFVSRFFAPSVGISEDPVTGSAHCCLGPYWAEKLQTKSLTGYQASARGGAVRVTVSAERAVLGGQAVTIARTELSDAAL